MDRRGFGRCLRRHRLHGAEPVVVAQRRDFGADGVTDQIADLACRDAVAAGTREGLGMAVVREPGVLAATSAPLSEILPICFRPATPIIVGRAKSRV
jgi:hypothetical protein